MTAKESEMRLRQLREIVRDLNVALACERSAGAAPLDTDVLAKALCKCAAAPFQTGLSHEPFCASYDVQRVAAKYARLASEVAS